MHDAIEDGVGDGRLAQIRVPLIAGELARADGEPREHGYVRNEHAPLVQDWYFPDDLPRPQLNALLKSQHRHIIDEVWPNTVQEVLGGKTPVEAAQAPELKAALALLPTLSGPHRRVLKVETYNNAATLASPVAPWLADLGFVRDHPGMAYYAGW